MPTLANVEDHLAPGITILLSKDLSVAVTVWGSLPTFVNVTLVPAVTVSAAGVKVLSPIATAAVAGGPACPSGDVAIAGVGGAAAGAGEPDGPGSSATAVVDSRVGAAAAAATTTTVPTIPGWNVHV